MAAATAPPVPTPAAPLDAEGRIHALDILRGLALFGMILVHFHQKMRLDAAGVEDLIGWVVWVLVEQKSWGVFALLFGVGFAIFLRRLEARGAPVGAVYTRRLATLAMFGVVAEVGFGFSILLTYAWWGLALLLVRRWSTRALLVTALLAAMARPVAAELAALAAWRDGVTLAPLVDPALTRAVAEAAGQGSYAALLSARWELFLGTHPGAWRAWLPDTNLVLFLLGFLAVRHGIVDDPRRHARPLAVAMAFGAFSWGCAWTFLRHLPETGIAGADWPLAAGLGMLQDQWLCLTYMGAGLLLFAHRPAWTARLRAVGQAGRMALTNYLLQAAVLDALASGWGAGLRLRPYHYVLAAPALFGVEAALSVAWLRAFRFGPLEWLWRVATYARPQPFRRDTPHEDPR